MSTNTRSFSNVVNDKTIAMNAFLYGYAGHSLVTPHVALQQVWWTEERINEKVTRDFITSALRHERELLERPVRFGDLSNDTYLDWILERARRLFLILAEVGVPDHIFGVIDNSWDDDDLPLGMDDIERLELPYKRNDQTDHKVFIAQFSYLLRELHQGAHIDYAPNEVIPLEYVHNLPPAVSLQNWSRVHLPGKPRQIFVRRKVNLTNPEGTDAIAKEFHMDVESAKMIEHDHIAPIWASYTASGCGYILTDYVGQHTLRTFIDHRTPQQYQKLPKPDRRYLLLGWMHCLADTVSTLHESGFSHGSIRPTNILIDDANTIAFSDIGTLGSFQKDKKPDWAEMYNYGAPELHTSAIPFYLDPAFKATDTNPHRKASVSSKGSSDSNKSQATKDPKAPAVRSPSNSISGFDFGFNLTKTKSKTESPFFPRPDEKADIFSLACIYIDILTFMHKKKAHDFTKHRSTKQKINGSKGGMGSSRTDSSFHSNLDKVETWMKVIEDAAFEQDDDAFRAVPPILNLIREMLHRNPEMRPEAANVRDRLLGILVNFTPIPNIHCSPRLIAPDDNTSIGVASSVSDRLQGSYLASMLSRLDTNERSDAGSSYAPTITTMGTPSITTIGSDWSRAESDSTAGSDDTASIQTSSTSTTSAATTTDTARVSSLINSYAQRNSSLTGTTFFDDRASVSTAKTMKSLVDPQMMKIAESPSQWIPPPSDSPPQSPRSTVPPQSPRESVILPPASPGLNSTIALPSPPSPTSTRPSSSRKNSRIMPWNRPIVKMP